MGRLHKKVKLRVMEHLPIIGVMTCNYSTCGVARIEKVSLMIVYNRIYNM